MKETTNTEASISINTIFAHSISVFTILFFSYIESAPLPATLIGLALNLFFVNLILSHLKK